MCKITSQSVWIGQLNETINGPTTNVRRSPRKTRTPCPMIIVESSNVLIWPLHAPFCNFSVIRIANIWMQQQFQFFIISGFGSWKKHLFRVVENCQKKTGFGFGKTRVGNTRLSPNQIVVLYWWMREIQAFQIHKN